MKFNIITKKLTIDKATGEYIEKKLSKLDKFFKEEPETRIVAGTVKDKEKLKLQSLQAA